jgi:glycosyltransferase involved in cell wall biosynthesis
VIIPCRNEAGQIEHCLESLLQQNNPPGGFEIVIADGMSTDGTRDILSRLSRADSRIRVIDNPQQITPTALNAAIRAAQGEIIVRMDAHTTYAPDYIEQCVKALESSGADNVGGPWIAKGETYLERAIAGAFGSPFGVGGGGHRDPLYEGEVETVYLGCWRREFFDRIGYFDEELVRNQDDEFNFRLIKSGGCIWQSPTIRSVYRPRGSLSRLWRQHFQYGYWKVRVMQKHLSRVSLRSLAPGTLVTLLAGLLLIGFAWHPAIWLWLGLAVVYGLFLLIGALAIANANGWGLLPILPIVLACYHLSYGLGFIVGLVDFGILHRDGRFQKLTR